MKIGPRERGESDARVFCRYQSSVSWVSLEGVVDTIHFFGVSASCRTFPASSARAPHNTDLISPLLLRKTPRHKPKVYVVGTNHKVKFKCLGARAVS